MRGDILTSDSTEEILEVVREFDILKFWTIDLHRNSIEVTEPECLGAWIVLRGYDPTIRQLGNEMIEPFVPLMRLGYGGHVDDFAAEPNSSVRPLKVIAR